EKASERFHQCRIVATSAGDEPFERWCWEMASRRRDRRSRHLGQGSGTVLERKVLRDNFLEIVAIERFRRRAIKVGRGKKSPNMHRRGATRARQGAVDVGAAAGVTAHPIVDQRIARAGVEGKNLLALSDP